MIYLLIGFLIFWILMCILAKNGGGGKLGGMIRNSDYLAWQDAVHEKEMELKELMKYQPKR